MLALLEPLHMLCVGMLLCTVLISAAFSLLRWQPWHRCSPLHLFFGRLRLAALHMELHIAYSEMQLAASCLVVFFWADLANLAVLRYICATHPVAWLTGRGSERRAPA